MSVLEEIFQEPFSFHTPLKPDVMGAAREALAASITHTAYDLARLLLECRSPIEQLMAAALWGSRARAANTEFHVPGEVIRAPNWSEKFAHFGQMTIAVQAPIGRYSADFLVSVTVAGKSARIAVECDGHDFHERTKQQAQHDKKRDRFFASQRLTVLRFTGSEITRDARECVLEAFKQLRRELHPKEGA